VSQMLPARVTSRGFRKPSGAPAKRARNNGALLAVIGVRIAVEPGSQRDERDHYDERDGGDDQQTVSRGVSNVRRSRVEPRGGEEKRGHCEHARTEPAELVVNALGFHVGS